MSPDKDLKSACHEAGNEWLRKSNAAKSPEDWRELFKQRQHDFPFKFGDCWKHTFEYTVDDFPAEIAFFLDYLGMSPNAFGDDYAMFTNQAGDFYFSLVPVKEGKVATPPDTIHLEFMLDDLFGAVEELKSRGVKFASEPKPWGENSPLHSCHFHTPNGIMVQLWGMVEAEKTESA